MGHRPRISNKTRASVLMSSSLQVRENLFGFFSLRKEFESAGVASPPPPVTLQPGTQHAAR